jgi:hypothetical protein
MPYIVMNLEEIISHIRQLCPKAELVIYRNHTILGGKHNRYLPKDCYFEQTGTAETAFCVSLNSTGKVTINDRADATPRYSSFEMLMLGARKLTTIWRSA